MSREATTAQEASARKGRIRGKRMRLSTLTSPMTLLIVAVTLLTMMGIVMVFSASIIELADDEQNPYTELVSQLIFVGIGLVAAIVLARVPYRFWLDKAIYVLWGATLLLLVAVLAAGTDSHGATRWLSLGGVGLQPSEFAKITIIMVGARIMAEHVEGGMGWKRFALLFGFGVLLPFGLILSQNDLGTLIILAATLICMMMLAEYPLRWIAIVVVLVAVAAIGLVFIASYRSSRFTAWLADPLDTSNPDVYYGDTLQIRHSLYAFASGGFFGVGLGNSRQKYSYLPEAENDFIFAIIGEELGLLGTMFVVLLFVLLGWSGLRIARQASNGAGKLLAGGLVCCILVQALVNMCGVLRILPLTGRPLPFISAGGSSMVATFMMVGLIISVARTTGCERSEGSRTASSRRNLRVIEGGAGRSGAAAGTRAEGRPAGARSRTDGRLPADTVTSGRDGRGGRPAGERKDERDQRGARDRSRQRSPRTSDEGGQR